MNLRSRPSFSLVLVNPMASQISQSRDYLRFKAFHKKKKKLPALMKAVPKEDSTSGVSLQQSPELRLSLANSTSPARSTVQGGDGGKGTCSYADPRDALGPGRQLGTPTLRTGRLRQHPLRFQQSPVAMICHLEHEPPVHHAVPRLKPPVGHTAMVQVSHSLGRSRGRGNLSSLDSSASTSLRPGSARARARAHPPTHTP